MGLKEKLRRKPRRVAGVAVRSNLDALQPLDSATWEMLVPLARANPPRRGKGPEPGRVEEEREVDVDQQCRRWAQAALSRSKFENGRRAAKDIRPAEMFVSLCFHFHFLHQKSWENKSIDTGNGRKLEIVGRVEVPQHRMEEGWTRHRPSSSLIPAHWDETVSPRVSRYCGTVIAGTVAQW